MLGLGPVEIAEVEPRRPGKAPEAEALLAAAGEGALLVAWRTSGGRAFTSREFAARIGGWRDAGERRVAFLLGGADGLDPALREVGARDAGVRAADLAATPWRG